MGVESSALVKSLLELEATDRRAMAVLCRSLAFAPGTWPPAYGYVEHFVDGENISPQQRNAAYLTAGLFAMYRKHCDGISVGRAFGQLAQKRPAGKSVEKRFLWLLGADDDLLPSRLRQAFSLLGAGDIGLDYDRLLTDLTWWRTDSRNVQQRWASDYYRRGRAAMAGQNVQDA